MELRERCDNLEKKLEQIRAKCEQYWNEPVFDLSMPEQHGILESIHRVAQLPKDQTDPGSEDKL